MEGSWLTLRKALHERYRDFQENGAAEQAASEADRGSESKGSGWGGEVLLPGLRWVRGGDGRVWSIVLPCFVPASKFDRCVCRGRRWFINIP